MGTLIFRDNLEDYRIPGRFLPSLNFNSSYSEQYEAMITAQYRPFIDKINDQGGYVELILLPDFTGYEGHRIKNIDSHLRAEIDEYSG